MVSHDNACQTEFLKVIPQKKLSNNFFKLSLNVPYQCLFRKIHKIKKIGHRACLGYMTGQTCPIYACTGINHARHFIGSRCILLQLEATVFEEPLEKNLIGRESRAYGTI